LARSGHAHQPLTTGSLARHRFDLVRQALDAFIEPPSVVGEPFDDARHARRDDVGRASQEARQFDAQEAWALPHCNAALQQGGPDLIEAGSNVMERT
jgi:hypothetical protein